MGSGRMESVRVNYDVPAYRGRRVLWLGDPDGKPVECWIMSSQGSHLNLRTLTGRNLRNCHPCWRIDYQDGRGDRTGQPTPMDIASRAASRTVVSDEGNRDG